MSECDNCNRNICHGCPYQEPDKSRAEIFADNLEIGWDYAVDMLEYANVDCIIKELCEIYYKAYTYVENNDIDSGKCFEIRRWAINEISKRLEA